MLKHKILKAVFLLAVLIGSDSAFARLELTDGNNFHRPGYPGGGYRTCEDIGWATNNRIRECSAHYRNNDRLFREDQYRYNLRNCYIHVDGSGDRFYFCDLGYGGGGGYPPPGGGYPPPGGGYPPPPGGGYPPNPGRSCYSVGWNNNYRVRDCVAPYRNNDRRFYDDAYRYRLRNCKIHVDGSGDRFYFCDLSR